MKRPAFENKIESMTTIVTMPPAVELLSDPLKGAAAWPKQIATNKEFIEQAEARTMLNERLDRIIHLVPKPDITLEKAIDQRMVNEQEVADLYTSLSELLESSDYERIALYLPFEFLPSSTIKPASDELKATTQRFRNAYKNAWNNLLTIQDVRANFVDGDILDAESRTGDVPRVVKAAHLIPVLVQKGFIDLEYVLELLEQSDDTTLRQSIAETLPVLADMGFIDKKIVRRLEASNDPFLKDQAETLATILSTNVTPPEPATAITAEGLENHFQETFQRIDSTHYDGITKKREAWIKSDAKLKDIDSVSDSIRNAVIAGSIDQATIDQLSSQSARTESRLAFIGGVRKAIESIAHTNSKQAQLLYDSYKNVLLTLWENNQGTARDALSKTFYRLHGLGIIHEDQLRTLGLSVPALGGPFSENIKRMAPEMEKIRAMIRSIEEDPELLKRLYPALAVFGSQIKGYGGPTADIDVAVFIRPQTTTTDATMLRDRFKKLFADDRIRGEVVEFWLEQHPDGLDIRDMHMIESWIGERHWTHVLFGSVWVGEERTLKELREQLLASYFFDDNQKILHDHGARSLYLEELERDMLQYRLMHKGYERFFPSYGGIHTPHADAIDGKSMFWDSGYRRTATKLFASNVFLPKLSKPE